MDNITFDELYGEGALKKAVEDGGKIPVKTYVYCDHGSTESGKGPWFLDTELVLPVFHAADTGDWDRYIFNLTHGTSPIIKFPYNVEPFAASLLFCCMKAICLQNGIDVSGSKESLFKYIRQHFSCEDQPNPALAPAEFNSGRSWIGEIILNVLSVLMNTRSSSSISLKDSEPDPSDLASLMWAELTMAVGEGIADLVKGVAPSVDVNDETIDGYSLAPYCDPYVGGFVAACMYDIPYGVIRENTAFGTVDDFLKRNEAAFVLSAGLIETLRILCGDFTPGMITEMFADECPCEECTRCKVNPFEQHVVVSESVSWEPVTFPDSMATAINSSGAYYSPFTAMTFCRGCAYSYTADNPVQGEELAEDEPTDEEFSDESLDNVVNDDNVATEVGEDHNLTSTRPVDNTPQEQEPSEESVVVENKSVSNHHTAETGSNSFGGPSPVASSSKESTPATVEDDKKQSSVSQASGVDTPLGVGDFWSDEDEQATKDIRY